DKLAFIQRSEGEKQSAINKAVGEAQAILSIAEANAQAIKLIAEALTQEGGELAVNQKLAAQYIEQFGNLAKTGTTLILPHNLSDIAGLVATALTAAKQKQPSQKTESVK
ncbi:MAG: band-7 C-terminal domain-containing protein, partial [Burkholderiales bacterium]